MGSGSAWTAAENAVLVRSYLDMLELELSGRQYSKAEFGRLIRSVIDRSKGAVEYKLQNVSWALLEINHPWIEGYKPARNIQDSLRSEVVEQLENRGELATLAFDVVSGSVGTPRIDFVWSVGDAPKVEWTPDVHRGFTPRHVDFVRIDAENRRLGHAGELAVVRRERERLTRIGRDDLAEKVEHVSVTRGDGAGYDILSWTPAGEATFIEVKTTRRGKYWPMLISRRELEFSRAEAQRFSLYRVHDFGEGAAGLFVLGGDVGRSCRLSPTAYQAVPA